MGPKRGGPTMSKTRIEEIKACLENLKQFENTASYYRDMKFLLQEIDRLEVCLVVNKELNELLSKAESKLEQNKVLVKIVKDSLNLERLTKEESIEYYHHYKVRARQALAQIEEKK